MTENFYAGEKGPELFVPLKAVPQIDKIAAALAKAQGEMKNPLMDSSNAAFKRPDGTASQYASLAAIRDAVVPALSKNEIAVIQLVSTTAEGVSVVTRLLHSSGQVLEFPPFFVPCEQSAQKIGTATTYGKRYTLSAAVCVAGENDDDGNSLAGVGPKVNAEQVTELRKLIGEVGADEAKLCKVAKVAQLEDVRAAQFPAVKAMIESKRK